MKSGVLRGVREQGECPLSLIIIAITEKPAMILSLYRKKKQKKKKHSAEQVRTVRGHPRLAHRPDPTHTSYIDSGSWAGCSNPMDDACTLERNVTHSRLRHHTNDDLGSFINTRVWAEKAAHFLLIRNYTTD
jgi:hypothetical protein